MAGLIEAAASDDRLKTLLELRAVLATAITECESTRDLPALTRQLSVVMLQIDEIRPPAQEVSPADEIAARRSARIAGPPRTSRARSQA